MITAMIIAGGSGVRMSSEIPKQFIEIFGKPVIVYTLEAFQNHPDIDNILVVCLDGWQETLARYIKSYDLNKVRWIVKGGKTGQESIRKGLFELEKKLPNDDIVLIHDAVRPMVSKKIISDCISTVKKYGNAIVAIPCNEAVLWSEDGLSSRQITLRDKLKRTQTPQGFYLKDICELHREAISKGINNSVASCTLMIELGREVYFSLGSEKNIKLTTPDDIDIFKALLTVERVDKNDLPSLQQ